MGKEKSFFWQESYIQIIGPVILFLGIVKIQTYYGEFGINILQFIEISEAVTLFLDVIYVSIIYFLAHFITMFFLKDKQESFETEMFQEILNAGSFIKRLKYYLFDILEIFLQLFVTLGVNFVIYYFIGEEMIGRYIFYTFILAIFLTIMRVIYREISYKNHVNQTSLEQRNFIYLAFLTLFIISVVIARSYFFAKAVKEQKLYRNVCVQLTDGPVIKSDDSLYYIGKTDNYVFIHNERRKLTNVIPITRIKEIVFPVN